MKFQPDGTGMLPDEAVIQRQVGDAAWVAMRRQRLRNLGCLMKSLKENISRRANREDQCSGAFWEGRYVSVPLLDQAILTVCMANVDLNPVRAKVAATPEDSEFISVRTRIRARDRAVKAARWQASVTTPAQQEQARRMFTGVGTLGSWAVCRVKAARRGVEWIRTRCPLFAARAA